MATKVKCDKCGAKNALDAQRCRLCSAIVKGGLPTSMPGAETMFRGGGGGGLGARIAAAGNAPLLPPMPDPAVSSDSPWSTGQSAGDQPWHADAPAPFGEQAPASSGFEAFDPNALFEAPPASSDDSSSSTAPVVQPFEPFDPDALFRRD